MRTTYDEQHKADDRVLAVALELSKASWKVALSDARHKPRIKNADAQQPLERLEQVLALIKDARARWAPAQGDRFSRWGVFLNGTPERSAHAGYGWPETPMDRRW